MLVSYNQLSDLTGKTYRTIKKRIDAAGIEPEAMKGNAQMFDSVNVLQVIYSTGAEDAGDVLDLQQERAKLAQAQTEKIEIQIHQMQGDLVPAEEVTKAWQLLVGAMRARLLSMPTKAAPLVMVADSQIEAKEVLQKHVHEALNELHTELSTVIAGELNGDG